LEANPLQLRLLPPEHVATAAANPAAARSAAARVKTAAAAAAAAEIGKMHGQVYERISGDCSRICRHAEHRHPPYRSGHMAGDPIKRKKGMKLDSLIP
jgi:hypothetical protein